MQKDREQIECLAREIADLRSRVIHLENNGRMRSSEDAEAQKPTAGAEPIISDQKLDKLRALHECEQTSQALLNATADSALLIDKDGIILDANENMAAALGKVRESLIGTLIYDHLPPDLADQRKMKILESARNRKLVRFEDQRGDRHLESSVYPILDPQGELIRFALYARDVTRQKHMEYALEQERRTAKMYLNTAQALIVVMDEKGRIELINRKGCHVLGYENRELIGEDFFDKCLPPSIRAEEKDAFLELVAGAANLPGYHENPVVTACGEERIIAWHSAVWRCEGGRILGVISSGEDVTERKQAEEKFHKAMDDVHQMKEIAEMEQAFTQAALDAQRGTFFVSELATGKPVRWNKTFSEITGYTNEEIACMKAPDDWYGPEDMAKVSTATERLIQGKAAVVEMALITKEGRRIATEYSLSLIPDGKGNPQYLVTVGRDITERKKTEEQLRNSEEDQRDLIENMPISCFKFDKEGRILSWNRTANEIYGYTKEEAIGSSAYDLIVTPATKEMTDRVIHEVFSGKTVRGTEWQDRNQAGEIGWRMGNNFPLLDTDGKVKCGVNLNTDITEKKRAEQRLQDAFQEIQQLNERVKAENIYLQQEILMAHQHNGIVGQSDSIKSVMALAEQVAATDSTVLILGETGTGKDLLARAIHDMSSRKRRPLVVVNCAAIPGSLVESELFGREKGAYTGAITKQIGRFEIANGSTIFLDEIAELSLDVQAKLLRVLQEGQIERLGSTKTTNIDVRVIAATNRDLEKEMKANKFREDLYYRLNVFPIFIPPLRERREDIPTLVWHFVEQVGQKTGKRIEKISQGDMKAMQMYPWPGNIRELRNVIERAMIQTQGNILRLAPLSKTAAAEATGRTLAEVERQHILNILSQTEWRVRGRNGAAAILGLKPTTLESRMSKLRIKRSAANLR